MGNKKRSLKESLDMARVGMKKGKIEIWSAEKEGREAELKEAIEWFFDNRDFHFGWSAFHKALVELDGWGDFPVGVKALQSYAKKHELEPGGKSAEQR
tara:strand:+ start:4710 stop:5003 length:294 start_codon:yes stop_codon:yes gene_type:complete